MASFLWRLLGYGPQRPLPAIVPTDEIVPMHPFDDTSVMRQYTLMWTFRFEEVLDADKLGNALSELFQMPGWRKLGGRFRLKPDGKAEIHIPSPFTAERPPLYVTKEHYDTSISEHPEASTLPKATGRTVTFPSARNYQSLGFGPGAPRTFDDYLHSDHPQFSLHVVTFTDGTLVSINFSHATTDLAGLMAVMNAWQLVLAGKQEDVPPFMGFKDDSMAGIYKAEIKEASVMADKQLSGLGLAKFGLRLMFETWWNPPIDSRTLCIPKKTMDAFVQAAREQTPVSAEGQKSFISEGDATAALFNQALAHGLPPQRPITTLQAVDPRGRITSVFQKDAAYVCNAPAGTFSSCISHEAVGMSIGELALTFRKAIQEQATEEQMKAMGALAYQSMIKTGNSPMFGDSNAAFLVISNWSKARFLEKVDFSPAIVKAAEANRPEREPGHPVYFHSQSLETGSFSANILVVMGRDRDGNFWVTGDLPSSIWPVLLAHLETYA